MVRIDRCAMKLVRLPSGPLACVYPVETDLPPAEGRGMTSGTYRAFSGSVEADGGSEVQALEALDECVRRLSVPPPGVTADCSHQAANDVSDSEAPATAPEGTGRYLRYSEPDTLPAPPPASSSRSR